MDRITFSEPHRLARLYMAERCKGYNATRAMERARAAYRDGKNGYATTAWYYTGGNADWKIVPGRTRTFYRWIESADTKVSSRATMADKILPLHHTGWFSDTWGDQTYRGIVFQLPAKDGKARFVAGYIEQEGANRKGGPVEMNPGSAIVYSDVFEASNNPTYDNTLDVKKEAARFADHMAMRAAEESREHDEAYDAGRQWSELGDEIAEARHEVMRLIAAMKAARKNNDPNEPHIKTLCDALKGQIGDTLRERSTKIEKRREIVSDWNNSRVIREGLFMSFNDGACDHVIGPKMERAAP